MVIQAAFDGESVLTARRSRDAPSRERRRATTPTAGAASPACRSASNRRAFAECAVLHPPSRSGCCKPIARGVGRAPCPKTKRVHFTSTAPCLRRLSETRNRRVHARWAVTVRKEEIVDPMIHQAQRTPHTGGPDITVLADADGAFSFRPHCAAARDFLAVQYSLISGRNLTKADLDRIVGLARGRRYAVLNPITFS
jgi:hypothetical protein